MGTLKPIAYERNLDQTQCFKIRVRHKMIRICSKFGGFIVLRETRAYERFPKLSLDLTRKLEGSCVGRDGGDSMIS